MNDLPNNMFPCRLNWLNSLSKSFPRNMTSKTPFQIKLLRNIKFWNGPVPDMLILKWNGIKGAVRIIVPMVALSAPVDPLRLVSRIRMTKKNNKIYRHSILCTLSPVQVTRECAKSPKNHPYFENTMYWWGIYYPNIPDTEQNTHRTPAWFSFSFFTCRLDL